MPASTPSRLQKLKDEGLSTLLLRRAFWYGELIKNRFARGTRPHYMEAAGRLVESRDNLVRLERMTFSTDLPTMDLVLKGDTFFGHYEAEQRTLLKRWLPPEFPVLEFGGGLGVVSCLANRMLKEPNNHIVVEANPQVVPLLESNRDRNGRSFRVVNRALAYGADTVEFQVFSSFADGRLNGVSGSDESVAPTLEELNDKPGLKLVKKSSISVPATTLEALADESGFDQFSLICDIEGSEALLVEHEIDVLRRRARFVLMEIHPHLLGQAGEAHVVQSMQAAGFTLLEECGINRAFARKD